jgi:protoheme IX farnesyltransferase
MSPSKWLHPFAIFTAASTFILLIVGGLVHGTGSSLACPDWPLCHGQFLPKMENGVLYEHSHRLVAGTVALLTCVLGVWIFLDRHRRALRPLAVAAPLMVLAQAVLGGLTVLYKLPKPITLSHLVLSMAFFSVLLVIAVRTRPAEIDAAQAPSGRRDLRAASGSWSRALVGLVCLAILGQIFLGGMVRHSMAGLACTTLPDCFGAYWPPDSESAYGERLHMLHRFGAVVLAILVFVSAALVFRRAPAGHVVRRLAVAAPIIVLVQITLGVLSVTSLLHLHTVTTHLAVGALLLAAHVVMWTLMRGLSMSLVAATNVSSAGDAPDAPPAAARQGVAAFARDVVALTKPRITLLVIITMLGGMGLAKRVHGADDFSLSKALFALLGTALVVSGASAFNMYLERDTDALMARTRRRPLPSGRLPAGVALAAGCILGIVSVPLLLWKVNLTTGLVAALALVTYAFVYTPLKRRTTLALPIGAVPGAVPPLLGWTAVTGRVDIAGLVLFAILFLWQLPHSLAIATFRSDDYRRAGTKVLPVELGDRVTRVHILVETILLVGVSVLPVPLGVADAFYLVSALLLGGAFLGLAAAGLRRTAGLRWARWLFAASILYLVLLMAALTIGG